MNPLLFAAETAPPDYWQPYATALIAFVGVGFSAIVAYAVSKYELTGKLQELREHYFHKLHEKRLEKYPSLYSLTGKVGYLMRHGPYTKEALQPLADGIAQWDQENGAYAGPKFIKKIFAARKAIRAALAANDIQSQRQTIYLAMVEVEFQLKKELGVYSASNFDEAEELRRHEQSFGADGRVTIKALTSRVRTESGE